MTHTPGPWAIAGMYAEHGLTNNDGSIAVMGNASDEFNPERVCLVDYIGEAGPRKRYNAPSEERDANATLIAAAPDLLAVAVMAEDFSTMGALAFRDKYGIEPGKELATISAKRRAAIAKAERR